MNSAQRRKCKRAWLRENSEEIKSSVRWINDVDMFIPSDGLRTDCIVEMHPETRKAFGFLAPKNDLREYLIKRGVDRSLFVADRNKSRKALLG